MQSLNADWDSFALTVLLYHSSGFRVWSVGCEIDAIAPLNRLGGEAHESLSDLLNPYYAFNMGILNAQDKARQAA